jgi:hypothetical protein
MDPRNLLIECKKAPWFDQESFSLDLSESFSRATLAPPTWNVTIIESCVSDNNNWYRPQVLKESMGVFEGAPCRIYFFDGRTRKDGTWNNIHNDHMPGWLAARDSGHVTGNTVGQFHDVDFKTIPSRRYPGRMNEAVVAKVTIIDPLTRTRLYESWQQGLIKPTGRSLFELSIEASGPHRMALTESGRQVRMVESIQSCKEVTIVSDGAAGGGFTSPVLSMSESSENTEKPYEDLSFDDLREEMIQWRESLFSDSAEDEEDSSENTLSESYLRKLGSPSKDASGAPLSGPNHSMEDDLNKETTDEASGEFQNDLFPKFGEDEISQIEKAKDVLRSGNQSMGIEILEKILEKRSKNGVMDQGNNPAKMFVKRESKTAKEPIKMPNVREYEESEEMGSYQESYGARDIEDFVRQMAIHNAQRDAQLAQLQESYSLVGDVIGHQQRYLRESSIRNEIRECEQILQNRLRESGLPVETQTLIAEQYSGKRFKESSLIQTINRHCRHLESIVGKVENNLREANPNVSYYDPYAASQRTGNMSYSRNTQLGHNPFDVVQAEIDRAFGYDFNLDRNLSESQRDLYRNLPNSPSIKRPMGIWHGDMDYQFNGQIGRDALLREAAASSDSGLTYLLQNSMTKSVMQRFMILPAEYREVCEIVPAANFLEHQVIVTGGLGYLPQVVESKTGYSYLTLGFPSTFQTKYTVGTFGGLISVTRQAIINDNLQEIQQYPKDAAESAMMTLNRNVFGTLFGMYGQGGTGAINSAVSYDNVNYYHANHLNVTNDPMSYDSLTGMQDRLFEQRNFGNTTTLATDISISDTTFVVTADKNDFINGLKVGDSIQIEAEVREVTAINTGTNTVTVNEAFAAAHTAGPNTLPVFQLSTPIAFNKRSLIVPTQLAHKAYQLLASALEPGTTTNSVSALSPSFRDGSLRLIRLHSMYMKNDKNNYFMVAGKPVRWAFLGGRETPEVMLKDNPLVDNVFSGDLISWKVRHEHGGVLMSHLPVQAGLVTG